MADHPTAAGYGADDPEAKRRLFRRLFNYAMLYKGRITIAMFILVASVVTQLAGPYIAKTIIDKHILGIQQAWYIPKTAADVPAGVHHVAVEDRTLVRADWMGDRTIPADWGKAGISRQNGTFQLNEPGGNDVKLTDEDVRTLYRYDTKPVLQLLGLYVALLVISGVLTLIQSYMLQKMALAIIQRMRMDVMRHIHRLPVRYFDNTPAGQVVSRIANDTEAIKELFMSFMATFVVSGVNLIGIYAALFLLDKRLALLCLILLPLFVCSMAIHLKYSKIYVTRMRARLSDMNAMLSESISVMPIIQAFRREKKTIQEFEALNDDRYINQIKQFRLFALSSRNIVGLIGALVTAGVIWYFGGRSVQAAISFGVFYAFIDYLGRIFQPIIGIFDQLMNAQRAVVSAERVFALMDREGVDIAEEENVPRPQGNVRFDNVSFAYNGEDYVLRNIHFEAKQGQTVALVGHTGSGKSSIMNLLLGFYEPTQGAILIDGQDTRAMSKQALRQHMGIVLQDPFLFAGDIKLNVSLYNKGIQEEQVKVALREVGASTFVEQLPKGYDEPVVERGSTLSAGQRQLVSFARALAYNPAILILDEATASIDSETESLIQHALSVLSRGRTTFVIAHRLSTIRDADTILVLHRGEIVERGNHEELMRLQGRYYRMHQLQKGDTAPSFSTI